MLPFPSFSSACVVLCALGFIVCVFENLLLLKPYPVRWSLLFLGIVSRKSFKKMSFFLSNHEKIMVFFVLFLYIIPSHESLSLETVFLESSVRCLISVDPRQGD